MKISKISLGSTRSVELRQFNIVKPSFFVEVTFDKEEDVDIEAVRKQLEKAVHKQLDALEHNERVRYQKRCKND